MRFVLFDRPLIGTLLGEGAEEREVFGSLVALALG